jgi:hypothetical protein
MMGLCRLIVALLLAIFAHAASAQPLDLVMRGPYSKHDTIPALRDAATFHGYANLGSRVEEHPTMSFRGVNIGKSIADVWCKTVTRMVYNNSRHPGYGDRVNQDNDGYGFKCRIDEQDPFFVSVVGLTNSWKGATFAISGGKQYDLLHMKFSRVEVSAYVGMSLTSLSYEAPNRHKDYYLLFIPMAHRGVSVSVSGLCTVGWEEELLPVDRIRLRSWNLRCEKRVNFF